MKTPPNRLNPFPGLRSFRSDEDYLFFGREEQTMELLARLQRNRFVAVVGTSGRGKSSLVRCGLLSRLQGGSMLEAGAHWEIAVMHPGGDPLTHLAAALLEAGLYDPQQENALPNLLATLGRSQFGLIEAVRQAGLPRGTNFLLVVDQFEEIFRFEEAGAAESELANDFIAMLREATAQTELPIYVVTTMRSDFIGDYSRFEGLAEAVNRGEYLIPRLSRDQFKSVIEGPIRVGGGRITPRLLQRLLNDLGEEQDQLPCLQHALMRTWRVWTDRPEAGELDLEDYQRVGKMSQALSLHADEVYFGLASDRQRHLCAAAFKALTVEGSEKRGIRRPRRLDALCRILDVDKAELTPVIDAFRQTGVTFLMPAAGVELRDTTIIDLSHESLMRVWARLRDWVDEEAKSVGIFRRLSESAALWREGKAGLYRDPELSIARCWLEQTRPNAAWAGQFDGNFDAAVAFLERSREAAEEDTRAKEAAHQRELEQAKALAEAERRRAEEQASFAARLKWLVRGLGLVAIFALTAMLLAIAARKEAQQNAELARQSESKAQAAGALVDNARGQAERLVAFLLEDFYADLEPTGRLETVAKLAREAVAYYDGLPAELRSANTHRNRAIALLRLGEAVYRTGKIADGRTAIRTALVEFEKSHASGNRSEATMIGLAAALRASVRTRDDLSAEEARELLARAIALLRPLAASAGGSVAGRVEFAEALRGLAGSSPATAETLDLFLEGRQVLAAAGALALTNLQVSSTYALVTLDMAIRNNSLRRTKEAERLYSEAVTLAEKVLALQPGDFRALSVSARANYCFATVSANRNWAEARRLALAAIEAYEQLVRFNPADVEAWTEVVSARRWVGLNLTGEGKIDEGLRYFRSALDTAERQRSNLENLANIPEAALSIAQYEAWRRNRAGAEEMLAEAWRLRRAFEAERGIAAGDIRAELWNLSYRRTIRHVLFHSMEYRALCQKAEEMLAEIVVLEAGANLNAAQRRTLNGERSAAYADLNRGNVMLGRWAEAEAAARRAVALVTSRLASGNDTNVTYLAIALGRQGQSAEALQILANSTLDRYRKAYADGDHALFISWRVARILYAEAIAQPNDASGRERSRAKLAEAKQVLDRLSAEAQDLTESREYRRLIEEESVKLAGK